MESSVWSSSPDDDQEENEEDNSEGFISGNGMPLDMPEKMWQDLDEASVHEESISELNRKCSLIRSLYSDFYKKIVKITKFLPGSKTTVHLTLGSILQNLTSCKTFVKTR